MARHLSPYLCRDIVIAGPPGSHRMGSLQTKSTPQNIRKNIYFQMKKALEKYTYEILHSKILCNVIRVFKTDCES